MLFFELKKKAYGNFWIVSEQYEVVQTLFPSLLLYLRHISCQQRGVTEHFRSCLLWGYEKQRSHRRHPQFPCAL